MRSPGNPIIEIWWMMMTWVKKMMGQINLKKKTNIAFLMWK